MGSKKKKRVSSSSSSSDSSSESSDSSPERRPKRKSKKTESKPETEESPKKTKTKANSHKKHETPPVASDEANKQAKKRDKKPTNEEETDRKRKRSPVPENRDRRERDDKRVRDDRGRHDDRRNRPNDHRSHDNRFRNRRPDYRDRERDYRNRRDDNKNYHNRERNRENHPRRRSRSASFDHSNARWGRESDDKKSDKKEKDQKEKQKPNFGLSGKLTEETNTYRGVVIKYSEPPEACKPKRRWRLYPFKGEKALQTLYIHRESAYLIGRDRKVVDLPVDHPSCSKQHAALQYRLVPFTREDGTTGKRIRPYLIDLNSANGTFINNKKIEPSKYVELLEKDVIKFGFSSREYVLLHENSKDETQDDDVKQEEPAVQVKSEEN
ncbi:uncharacterized protein LOC661495 [Tribolium castaneum]|uniref:Smad nuclear-interacting protein 1-like Protein n=1 Tax=Tribolium castaneum TaxID=7070 RepID=D6WBA4_TRICA|nr:PREDICTED: FHA domain-containing protein DDL [Tribolium castaneum]EEZ98715.1 Smad nuclear-interacting protein 1-like Protein [Tribolium castaneum]|eukprot:XP_972743.1 PREDICTED: FHA domain-containing protein DDL [Tribolium castaneum]